MCHVLTGISPRSIKLRMPFWASSSEMGGGVRYRIKIFLISKEKSANCCLIYSVLLTDGSTLFALGKVLRWSDVEPVMTFPGICLEYK